MKKLTVLDGNSLLFRAFYATYRGEGTPIMCTKDGTPTNAIFAFSNMLAKIISSLEEEEGLFVGFDADSKTFRKEEFEAYKANRKPCPEELVPQFPLSRELLDCLGVVHYERQGIEADDICGTVAKRAAESGCHVDVYTSDKDYLQLVDERITVHLIRKGLSDIQDVTPANMEELFGFAPKQIIDYKGLRGDASDNLPGIRGIGEKTAVKLLQDYGDFESIVLAAKDGRIKGKVAENIIEGEEMGRMCLRLATIVVDADLPFYTEELRYAGYSFDKVNAFCQKYELRHFLSRLPARLKVGEKAEAVPEPEIVSELPEIHTTKIGLAIDVDGKFYHTDPVMGLSLAIGGHSYYLSVDDAKNDAKLKQILLDPTVTLHVYDSKATIIALHRIGLEVDHIDFDLHLAAYILDSSIADDAESVLASFGEDISPYQDEPGGIFSQGAPNRTSALAHFALSLYEKALSSLKDNECLSVYQEIELPLSAVLASMEEEGFPLDGQKLSDIGADFRRKRDDLEKQIRDLAGYPINVSSPKQVGELLFQTLNLAGGKNPGTSVDVLKGLAWKHPIIPLILEYRKYAKLVSTYIDGLLPHIGKDGKIHTYFNQAQTTTGRLSSSNPNLQNISARDPESKSIRKAFYYEDPDISIASFDYGQIELRILAALSSCQAYIDIFSSDRDVHSETARRIFNIPEGEEVPSALRRRAKAVNFAIIYGVTPFGLAEQIDGTPTEAVELIASFKRHYPEVDAYLQSILQEVESKGYVKTLFGRRRYLRDVTDANYAKREAAKRAALNAPVQGTAADLIKIAMLKVDRLLKEGGYKTKMVLQIHDELLFAVAKGEEGILPLIEEAMTHAVDLPVKLTVESSIGKSWYEAKD